MQIKQSVRASKTANQYTQNKKATSENCSVRSTLISWLITYFFNVIFSEAFLNSFSNGLANSLNKPTSSQFFKNLVGVGV